MRFSIVAEKAFNSSQNLFMIKLLAIMRNKRNLYSHNRHLLKAYPNIIPTRKILGTLSLNSETSLGHLSSLLFHIGTVVLARVIRREKKNSNDKIWIGNEETQFVITCRLFAYLHRNQENPQINYLT